MCKIDSSWEAKNVKFLLSWSYIACNSSQRIEPKTRAFVDVIYFGSFDTMEMSVEPGKFTQRKGEGKGVDHRIWELGNWEMEKEGKAANPKLAWIGLYWAGYCQGNWEFNPSGNVLEELVWNMPLKYLGGLTKGMCIHKLLPHWSRVTPGSVNIASLCRHTRVADQASSWDSCNQGRKALGEKIVATQYSWDQVLLAYTWVQLLL